jgi:hypothetical protein
MPIRPNGWVAHHPAFAVLLLPFSLYESFDVMLTTPTGDDENELWRGGLSGWHIDSHVTVRGERVGIIVIYRSDKWDVTLTLMAENRNSGR